MSKTLTAVPEAFRNLWTHRGLIRNFTSGDISQRYHLHHRIFLDRAEPLLLSAVYYFLFTIISGNRRNGIPCGSFWEWWQFSQEASTNPWCLTGQEHDWQSTSREKFCSFKGACAVDCYVHEPLRCRTVFDVPRHLPHLSNHLCSDCIVAGHPPSLGRRLAVCRTQCASRGYCPHDTIHHACRVFVSPVMWTISMAKGGRAELLDYLFLNPMVLPLELMRSGFDGTEVPVPTWAVAWCLSFRSVC